MNYWLLKTEPETFSWSDLVRDKKAVWDGVRNFQARKHLKEIQKGDLAFIYHTGEEKSIIGISKVTRDGYPELKDPDWIAVDLTPEKALKNPVSLSKIKSDKSLQNMVLVRASRLSVQPVTKEEYEHILKLSSKP
ncbi:MAG TPA: EVE domain-containing protein [Cyclobacteriaceae bacterium]|nr:EVE domain-containing protein [Cyclobacteriaceae bacterium]